ncbi:cupin [Scytonema hofmannii PCC 7110]|uniref:Cupin n=1 Tax=Scytonema hofmannii PCC 7110 TaxID=128403 RepID=A0A139X2T1_9CYAN|nr:cupin domain-containing protein [Scytonema hofmannii]KYC39008.1 cupin [Scytonema hofmannii PCC 7110]
MTSENQDVTTTKTSAETNKRLNQGHLKTLEEVIQFNPEAYVKRPIFNTETLQFGMYCLEPGQINPLHQHPQTSEICYFVQGTGEVVIGDEVAFVQPGVSIHVPEAVRHEIRNTGTEQMLVVVVQSPLPCKTERITP